MEAETAPSEVAWWPAAGSPPGPGAPIVVAVDGTDVAVAAVAGGLVAFDDTCTHRMCPLSEGVLDETSVTCPCHKSRFELATGRPLNGPATEPIRVRRVSFDGTQLLIER